MDLFSDFFSQRFPPFENDGFLYFSLVPNHPDARFWYFHSPLKINFCQSWIPQFPIRPLAPVHMFLFIFFESLILLVGNFHCQKMPNFNIFNSSQTQPALKINFHKSWIFHNFRFRQRHQCRSESFLDSFNFCINLSEFWPGFIITTIAPTPLQSKSDLSPVRGQPHVLSICKRGLGGAHCRTLFALFATWIGPSPALDSDLNLDFSKHCKMMQALLIFWHFTLATHRGCLKSNHTAHSKFVNLLWPSKSYQSKYDVRLLFNILSPNLKLCSIVFV